MKFQAWGPTWNFTGISLNPGLAKPRSSWNFTKPRFSEVPGPGTSPGTSLELHWNFTKPGFSEVPAGTSLELHWNFTKSEVPAGTSLELHWNFKKTANLRA